MRQAILCVLGAGVLLVLGAVASAASPPKPENRETARLIARLGSKDFHERESATEALGRLGAAALDPLRRASQGNDPEIRRRAALLVQRIEKHLESDRLLAPRHLHLQYADVPVTEAVRDLAHRTGLSIILNDHDRSRLASRRLTLDTGETTFWEAFDQFCRKAGLVERSQEPAPSQPDRVLTDGRGNQIIVVEHMYSGRAQPQENRLVLADGKPEALPTWHTGGVRVRALPPSTLHPGLHKTRGQTFLLLEVMPGPGINWHGVVDVQIERAVDEHGQTLEQVLAGNPAAGLDLDLGMNVLPLLEVEGELIGSNPRYVPVHLRRGKEPSRVLKEVRGTAAGRVETTETLLTIDDLAKAGDRNFRGTDGSTVRVVDYHRDEDGRGRLRVQLETPRMMLGRGAARVIRGNRRIIFLNRGGSVGVGSGHWSLVDARGQKVSLSAVSQRVAGGINGFSQETTFLFSAKEVKAPLKLLYSGSRTVTVEITFTLKDVPLP